MPSRNLSIVKILCIVVLSKKKKIKKKSHYSSFRDQFGGCSILNDDDSSLQSNDSQDIL